MFLFGLITGVVLEALAKKYAPPFLFKIKSWAIGVIAKIKKPN